jgi:hypothetical protein
MSSNVNQGCTNPPGTPVSISATDMGNCILHLYPDLNTCNNNFGLTFQEYTSEDEGDCHPVGKGKWTAFQVISC